MEEVRFLELGKLIHDKNPQIRIKAIEILAEQPTKESVDYLFQSLLYPVSVVNAVYAIAKLKEISLPLVIEELQSNSNQQVRDYLLYALGLMRDEKAIEPLKAVAKDPKDNLRIRAINLLNKFYYTEQLAIFFIEQLNNEPSTEIKRELIEMLGQSKETKAVMLLLTFLQQKNIYLSRKAALSLGEIGDERAILPLLEALKSDKPELRKASAEALGNFNSAETIEALIQALKDESVGVRQQAILSLVKIGSEKAIQPLLALITDKSFHVQPYAIEALGVFAAAEALAPLEQLEKSINPQTKTPLGSPVKSVITIAIQRIKTRQAGSLEKFEFLIR